MGKDMRERGIILRNNGDWVVVAKYRHQTKYAHFIYLAETCCFNKIEL
jgi:hypothetical protein